jgi:hypothetical protein
MASTERVNFILAGAHADRGTERGLPKPLGITLMLTGRRCGRSFIIEGARQRGTRAFGLPC